VFDTLLLTNDTAALYGGGSLKHWPTKKYCCPVWWTRFRMLWLTKDIAALCGGRTLKHCCQQKSTAALYGGHASECCG